MNKKGFTLVEILAVIVLIVVISLLVFPSILNSIKKSQDEIDDATRLLLINAAKLYVDDNSDNYKEDNQTYCINVQKLIDNNYLSEDILSAYDGEDITKNKIKLDKSGKNNYSIVKDCIPTDRIIIAFDTNGGSFIENIYLEEPDQFEQSELPTPIYTDNTRTFLGWYKDRDLKQKLDSLDTIDTSITLYAKWGKERLFLVKDGVSLYPITNTSATTTKCEFSNFVLCANNLLEKTTFLDFKSSDAQKFYVPSESIDMTDYSLLTIRFGMMHGTYITDSQLYTFPVIFGIGKMNSSLTNKTNYLSYIEEKIDSNYKNGGFRYLIDHTLQLSFSDISEGYPFFTINTSGYWNKNGFFIFDMYME